MTTKNEYIDRLASELKDWSAKIDLLSAKKDKAEAEAKLKYVEELNALRIHQHAAAEKIKELEEAGSEAWETVKVTADKVWDDFREVISNAAAKFS